MTPAQPDAVVLSDLSGLLLGLVIGAGCRWFDLPVPAPPRIIGALLVVAMSLGFVATDQVIGAISP